jgi:hypothetical protein
MANVYSSPRGKFSEVGGGFEGIFDASSDELDHRAVRS